MTKQNTPEFDTLDIIQSVSGNWSVRDKENNEFGGPFRNCGDAQEWINANDMQVGEIRAWKFQQ